MYNIQYIIYNIYSSNSYLSTIGSHPINSAISATCCGNNGTPKQNTTGNWNGNQTKQATNKGPQHIQGARPGTPTHPRDPNKARGAKQKIKRNN